MLFVIFVHLIYLKHVSIGSCFNSKEMSWRVTAYIGNGIHIHLEGYIIVLAEILQSAGIQSVFWQIGHFEIQ